MCYKFLGMKNKITSLKKIINKINKYPEIFSLKIHKSAGIKKKPKPF